MPDWSYRTLLRPLLFALPPEAARRLTVGVLGGLARLPGGPACIDLLGHMRADPRLARGELAGPVGLGASIDPEGVASRAFARFGVGFIELGPVRMAAGVARPGWQRNVAARALTRRGESSVSVEQVRARLSAAGAAPTALWIRISAAEPEPRRVVEALQPWAAGFALEVGAAEELPARVRDALAACPRALVVSLLADESRAVELATSALACGATGVWVRGELASGECGAPAFPEVSARVRELRAVLPDALLIGGGVGEPEDVRQLAHAGAQLYTADAGLVFSGPGLIKRCNEALLFDAHGGEPRNLEPLTLRAARNAWFWALCLGVAMFAGGAMALAIANTRVVLPYDESLCGMNRSQLNALNPRLLPFMRHDRVTLAGSMLSIGILYSALALSAIRRGAHWAQVTVVVSAFAGFLSLFYFLGFGYFDPFHAFVSSVLFQFLLLCLLTPLGDPQPPVRAEWRETPAWRAGQWGQLLFVIMGVGLVGAGLVITYIGLTDVFVREDLEFMRTSAAQLLVAHERLVPLVAHDRASLGGMLIANGIAISLCALWGFRSGERWLWRALAWAGNLAFATAIGVHYVVGYESLVHLAPAYAGLVIWWLALALTRGWLTAGA